MFTHDNALKSDQKKQAKNKPNGRKQLNQMARSNSTKSQETTKPNRKKKNETKS